MPTPEDILALLPRPPERARRLAGVLAEAIDSRDVREAAWRARDAWLYWDYAALEAARAQA